MDEKFKIGDFDCSITNHKELCEGHLTVVALLFQCKKDGYIMRILFDLSEDIEDIKDRMRKNIPLVWHRHVAIQRRHRAERHSIQEA